MRPSLSFCSGDTACTSSRCYLFVQNLGYDVAKKFMTSLHEVEAAEYADTILTGNVASQPKGRVTDNDPPSQGKATDKCLVNLSTKKSDSLSATAATTTEPGETMVTEDMIVETDDDGRRG